MWLLFLLGAPSLYAGRPGRGRNWSQAVAIKEEQNKSGAPGLITDWERCVKTLWVSSRENWAHRLLDRTSSYWQSCGMQGKVNKYSFKNGFK